jgi:UDP-N-acetylmuramoyl-L-alanyl-D-glutamate--2,6-diaminopimelate ligase
MIKREKELMNIKSICEVLGCSTEEYTRVSEVQISGIKSNSQFVEQGDLFVALKGYDVDGHDYIEQAICSGAVAVIGEADLHIDRIPYIKVSESREALAKVASSFYNYPYKKHIMIGVTGTNGKTSTSYLLKHILEQLGKTCSLIGTINTIINNETLESKHTTPDSLELNRLLEKSNDEVVIMEVSSHGIEQKRIEGIYFDYALFTNLSHDHLDYHNNMMEYFQVKARLFHQMKSSGKAIIATYTEWGMKLADFLATSDISFATLGWGDEHDLTVEEIIPTFSTIFKFKIEGESNVIRSTIPGIHNGWNLMSAILTANKMGYDIESILDTLSSFSGIPGRYERYYHPVGSSIIIDYAHTADAIQYCLETAAQEDAAQIIHVFGFRGNRDVSKRKSMIEGSKEISSLIILTMDDLCGETEEDMINDLYRLKEERFDSSIIVIPDRTKAIEFAWRQMKNSNDWIFITGKGHEKYEQSFELPCQSDKETVLYLNRSLQH